MLPVGFITEMLLRADARGEALGPVALRFLVRRYAEAGGGDVGGALERGLTNALDQFAAGNLAPAWIHTLCEAAAVTDDERILSTVAAAARTLRERWPNRGALTDAMLEVDACLAAAANGGGDLIRAGIDELERMIGLTYRPGERLPASLRNPDEEDGGSEEHVATAAALLTAHDLTGRLPYSMLAEELIQTVSGGPDRLRQGDGGPPERSAKAEGPHYERGPIPLRCAVARVLCRLARLHDDEEYRRAAVIAGSRDYRADAAAILESITLPDDERGEDAADVGLAADELARSS